MCMTAKAQGPSNADARKKANELANKAFIRRFSELPASGYVGPVSTAKMYCLDVVKVVPRICQVVIEYKNPTFTLGKPQARTPADIENKVWKWTVIADFQIFRLRHIADGTWGPWTEWQDRQTTQEATYEVMKLRYTNGDWTWEPGDDLMRFIQGFTLDLSQDLALSDIQNPAQHDPPPTAANSVHCHNSLNQKVPVQEVLREDAFRWCGITPQRWDEITGHTPPLQPAASGSTPAGNGVTWTNGDPAFTDGRTRIRLSHALLVIEQGSTSARFYISPLGTGIVLVPPPDARSRETYNTQTHQYVNSNPGNGEATGTYLNGPPPGMMAKLGPFVVVAMQAIDQAKQTPAGASWDDRYYRNILRPYVTVSAPSQP
jgi:hypothetical protein